MTGLIGILFLMGFLLKGSYLFFPSLWTEYFLEGATDRYQFGFGIWYGKVWGLCHLNMTEKELGAVMLSVIGEKKTIYLSFHSGSLKD